MLSRGRIVADGMLREKTPIEDRKKEYGLWVKREDLACPNPGPPFSKTRGVYAIVKSLNHDLVGVLDTYHSQAGHAVARACQILGKRCLNFYPEYKKEPGHRAPQDRSKQLGAELVGLPAGRSCILFHQARKIVESQDGYMMPNALKLHESIEETAKEVRDLPADFSRVIIPISSGTIAAGVIRGFHAQGLHPEFIAHMGYSRSHGAVRKYISQSSGVDNLDNLSLIDEGYSYKDKAKWDSSISLMSTGPVPNWPCNDYYDLKAFWWWMRSGRHIYRNEEVMFWNVG